MKCCLEGDLVVVVILIRVFFRWFMLCEMRMREVFFLVRRMVVVRFIFFEVLVMRIVYEGELVSEGWDKEGERGRKYFVFDGEVVGVGEEVYFFDEEEGEEGKGGGWVGDVRGDVEVLFDDVYLKGE